LADKTGKGKMLLRQKIRPSELAPDFLVRWQADRQDVFFDFTFIKTASNSGTRERVKASICRIFKDKTPVFHNQGLFQGVRGHREISRLVYHIGPSKVDIDISIIQAQDGQDSQAVREHGCTIERRIVTNDRMIYDYSIKRYSFDAEGFTIVFYDGLERNYLWDDVEHVSDLTDDPYKIEFYCGAKCSSIPWNRSSSACSEKNMTILSKGQHRSGAKATEESAVLPFYRQELGRSFVRYPEPDTH